MLDRLADHVVHSPRSYADIGSHVFPMEKYGAVHRRLVEEDGLEAWLEPEPASRENLLRVHSERYLDDLEGGRHTARTVWSELPLTKEITSFYVLACGGTTLAARCALDRSWAVHIGGGFHHAFREKAEGFCYLNDLAVAARAVQAGDGIERVAIVDLDVHQGNGTASIFAGDASVFTFSIHQQDNYPVKESGDRDIGLVSFDRARPGSPHVTDELYLSILEPELERVLDDFEPELVLVQAGADPYERDQLGGFRLTLEGIRRRDAKVFHACRDRDVPVAVTFGGGYAEDVRDTVAIHVGTIRAARATWGPE